MLLGEVVVKLYKVIVADPSWRFRDTLPGNRGVDKKYKSTMRIDQIRALQIPPTEPDALLFLWRVSSMVPEAYDVCRAWGFTGKSEIVWFKTESYVGLEPPPEPDPPRMPGMGHYVRNDHEVCIVAEKGTMLEVQHDVCIVANKGSGCQLIQNRGVRSCIWAPRPERHSEKPAVFFELLDRLLGDIGPRAELFARDPRPGYDTFGDEIGSEIGFGLLP
jgi:N6-adenosine-specific RNA methylase IME4